MDKGRNTAEGWGLEGFPFRLLALTWVQDTLVLSSIRLFFSMAFAFAVSQKRGHAGGWGEGINQRLQPASIHLYLFIPAEALLCFASLCFLGTLSRLVFLIRSYFGGGPFFLFLQPTYIPHCFIHPFVLSVTYLLTSSECTASFFF